MAHAVSCFDEVIAITTCKKKDGRHSECGWSILNFASGGRAVRHFFDYHENIHIVDNAIDPMLTGTFDNRKNVFASDSFIRLLFFSAAIFNVILIAKS